MPNPKIVDLENQIIAKTGQLEEIFAESGPERDLSNVKSLDGDSDARLDQVKQRNTELAELHKKLSQLRELEEISEDLQPAPEQPVMNAAKNMGFADTVVQSKPWRDMAKAGLKQMDFVSDMEMKTLFSSVTISSNIGFPPEATRTGDIVMYPSRPLQLLDRIRQIPTDQNTVLYMEQTIRNNAAAETTEASAYPESGMTFAEQSSPVRKIGTFIPATQEQLDDVASAHDLLDAELRIFLKQRLDEQIQIGNGTPPNLQGILGYTAGPNSGANPSSGNIGLVNRGDDPHHAAIFKAITRCRLYGRAIPDTVVVHPLDWEEIRLTTTADGQYLWGNPAINGVMTIHGLPVIISDSLTLGDAIVGDFGMHCYIRDRRDVNVMVTNSHSDNFTKDIIVYRADIRCAFVVRRKAAFWKVDFNA